MKTNKEPIKPITLKNKESDYIIKFNFYISNLFYADKNIYYNNPINSHYLCRFLEASLKQP